MVGPAFTYFLKTRIQTIKRGSGYRVINSRYNIRLLQLAQEILDTNGRRYDSRLMKHQAEGVRFLEQCLGGCLIGDDMGIGKTFQVLAFMERYASIFQRVLVIVPAFLLGNWEAEIRKWFPDMTFGAMLDRTNAKINLISYTSFVRYYDKIRKWRFDWDQIVFDEAHYLQNRDAKRTKYCLAYSRRVPSVIFLTGTPFCNRPSELFYMLQRLDRYRFGTKAEYGAKFCDAKKTDYGWDYSGASNLPQLRKEIKHIAIRRTKAILKGLPKRIKPIVIWIPGDQRPVADHLEKERVAAMDQKKPVVEAWIKNFIHRPDKLIVFGYHRAILIDLAKQFNGALLLGGMTKDKRTRTESSFKDPKGPQILFANLEVAGLGLNLQCANYQLHIELCWNALLHRQGMDRSYRIGQKNPVFIYYLLQRGGVDEILWRVYGKKLVNFDTVFPDPVQVKAAVKEIHLEVGHA